MDGSSGSSGSDGSRHRNSGGELGLTRSQEDRQAAQAAQEAEARVHTADYVEARGYLQPATDFLRRAVEEATSQSNLTGHLLITVSSRGEIPISFANTCFRPQSLT